MNTPPEVPAIQLTNVTKRFGKTKAMDDLSFTIPAGVIAGFVGPNGSGKTTTMRILATLLRQDSGEAQVFGNKTHTTSSAKKVRHAIGFMPDYFGLYADMTAGEYLDFFGAAYRIPYEKRLMLVNDMLALVNLSDKKDTLISGLSRGMQQKLSLGRALIHSPRLLLLDEPASGLDPRARIELMELLRELKSMGKTIFISSHILTELQNICDMVVILENGKKIFSGSVADASAGVMEGYRFVELEVGTDPDQATEALQQIEGIEDIRRKDQMLLIEHSIDISSSDIVNACVAKGIRVDEIRRGSANLEEIFMHMTKTD